VTPTVVATEVGVRDAVPVIAAALSPIAVVGLPVACAMQVKASPRGFPTGSCRVPEADKSGRQDWQSCQLAAGARRGSLVESLLASFRRVGDGSLRNQTASRCARRRYAQEHAH